MSKLLIIVDYLRVGKMGEIPKHIADKVLVESRHQCCICEGTEVQVHHIIPQEEGGTSDEENLIVLCLNCHSRAHRKGGLGRRITPKQLKEYKRRWISKVSEEVVFEKRLFSRKVETYPYAPPLYKFGASYEFHVHLLPDRRLTGAFSSDKPVEFMIMNEEEYQNWIINRGCWMYYDVKSALEDRFTFKPPHENNYYFVFVSSTPALISFELNLHKK